MAFRLVLTKQARKDAQRLENYRLDSKAKNLLKITKENFYENPLPYENLMGDLKGFYSKRINIQHRLVYQVLEEENVIKILRMWNHYE